jgi:DNA gyrase subunit A
VRAITLREGDKIVGFDAIESEEEGFVLVVTNDGFGKRVRISEFRQQGRGGIGLIGTKFKNAQSRLATLRIVHMGEEMMIATANGVVVRQKIDDISLQGRMATGVRLQQLGEDDWVVNVTPIVEPTALTSGEGGGDDEADAPDAT